LILTDQVWMEFLKNRQKVIFDSLKQMKRPEKISFPPFISDYQSAKTVMASVRSVGEVYKKVEDKIDRIVKNPSQHDEVYKGIARIFAHKGPYCLTRDDKVRFTVRNLARKRFALGYPPRKSQDTSIGDAVNWEWIIHCAITCPDKCNILIVSRDTDYGFHQGQEGYLNDWLAKEFKERVSRQRSITLTPRLTSGLKKLAEQVSKADEREEAQLIASDQQRKVTMTGPTITGVSLEQLNQQILSHLRPSTPSETNLDDGVR
jgi:hypothetical protein